MRQFVFAMFVLASLQLEAAADEYGRALDALKVYSQGFGIKDTKDARHAQDALWQAAQQWTMRYLDAYPAASPADLADASKGSDSPQLSAIVLDAKAMLVATQFGETGNVFAVARGAQGFAVVWDIAKAAPPKRFANIAAWSLGGAAGTCRPKYGERDWDQCGPYHATLMRLSNDGQGRTRFAIDAAHAQEAGLMPRRQISVWRWNGQAPELLLAETYSASLSDETGVRIEDGRLVVREAGGFVTRTRPRPARDATPIGASRSARTA